MTPQVGRRPVDLGHECHGHPCLHTLHTTGTALYTHYTTTLAVDHHTHITQALERNWIQKPTMNLHDPAAH